LTHKYFVEYTVETSYSPSISSFAESEEERAAMLKALRQSENLFSRYYLNEDFNDIQFDFELRDDIVIGSPFRYIKE
jgi:tellurite resistance protein